jgi:hypothetical protein
VKLLDHIKRECVKVKRIAAICFRSKSNLLTEIDRETEQAERLNSHLVCVPRWILRHGCRFLQLAATLHEYTGTPQELPKSKNARRTGAAKKKERFDRSHSVPNLISMPPLRSEAQVASLKNFD